MASKLLPSLQFFSSAGYGAPVDGNWAWEWWYRSQVIDNIALTPAFFYLSQPNGQATWHQNGSGYGNLGAFGDLLKTTFKF